MFLGPYFHGTYDCIREQPAIFKVRLGLPSVWCSASSPENTHPDLHFAMAALNRHSTKATSTKPAFPFLPFEQAAAFSVAR